LSILTLDRPEKQIANTFKMTSLQTSSLRVKSTTGIKGQKNESFEIYFTPASARQTENKYKIENKQDTKCQSFFGTSQNLESIKNNLMKGITKMKRIEIIKKKWSIKRYRKKLGRKVKRREKKHIDAKVAMKDTFLTGANDISIDFEAHSNTNESIIICINDIISRESAVTGTPGCLTRSTRHQDNNNSKIMESIESINSSLSVKKLVESRDDENNKIKNRKQHTAKKRKDYNKIKKNKTPIKYRTFGKEVKSTEEIDEERNNSSIKTSNKPVKTTENTASIEYGVNKKEAELIEEIEADSSTSDNICSSISRPEIISENDTIEKNSVENDKPDVEPDCECTFLLFKCIL